MSIILLTWELGGNAGHIQPLGKIANELKKRGHKVLVAVNDVCIAKRHLTTTGVEFVQAPVWSGCIDTQAPSAVNYAELLMLSGYLNSNQVAGQIRSWIHLMEWVKPDLVLANHSPSVLLASQIARTKAMTLGTGFHSPPAIAPMPCIQPYARIADGRLSASENKVLATINQAISKCGGTPLDKLSGIFESCDNYFLTLPDTDHYGARKDANYWGIIPSSENTIDPIWPKGYGPRVYVYMQHHAQPYQSILTSLQQLGWPSLVVSRNINMTKTNSFASDNIKFSSELLNLEAVAKEADVIVNNCNHGTVVEMLQRGCRQLVIPLQTEQSLLAYRLSGKGLVIAGKPTLPCYSSLIERTHSDPTLKSNVERFREFHGDLNSPTRITTLLDDIEQHVVC